MPYKKIAFFVVLALFLLTINNLIHSIHSTWQKQHLIVKAQEELDRKTTENLQIKQDLLRVNKPEFIESEARNKLLLTKPGEGIVVIPTTAIIVSPTSPPRPIDRTPNWQKWWNVFF